MDQEELSMLEALDLAVRAEAVRPKIDAMVARVEQKLRERPDDVLAWEPIPLDCYTAPLPATIRSSGRHTTAAPDPNISASEFCMRESPPGPL